MERIKGMAFLTGAFFLAGSSVISARLLSGRVGAFTIAFISLLLATLALVPFCYSNIIKNIKGIGRKGWLSLFLQALFGIFLFRFFLLSGLLHTSSSEAGIMTGATPAVTAVLAMIILKEPVSKYGFIGLCSTIGGILLIQGVLLPGNKLVAEHLIGNMLVLCAAISESLFNILSRIYNLRLTSNNAQPDHPITQTTLVCAMALVLCIVPSLLEQPIPQILSLELQEWLALAWYGFFVTAIAFVFWYQGIKRCPAVTAAAFSGMMPFTSLILSIILLQEQVIWQQWFGGLLVITGMVLIGAGQSIPASKANQYIEISK